MRSWRWLDIELFLKDRSLSGAPYAKSPDSRLLPKQFKIRLTSMNLSRFNVTTLVLEETFKIAIRN